MLHCIYISSGATNYLSSWFTGRGASTFIGSGGFSEKGKISTHIKMRPTRCTILRGWDETKTRLEYNFCYNHIYFLRNFATVVYHGHFVTVVYHGHFATVVYHGHFTTVVYHGHFVAVVYHRHFATVGYHGHFHVIYLSSLLVPYCFWLQRGMLTFSS